MKVIKDLFNQAKDEIREDYDRKEYSFEDWNNLVKERYTSIVKRYDRYSKQMKNNKDSLDYKDAEIFVRILNYFIDCHPETEIK